MNLAKQFIKDSTVYALQPIMVQGISFFLIPLYTIYLTPADYGNLNYVLAFSSFFRAFVGLGLGSSFWKFRTKSEGYSEQDIVKALILAQIALASTIIAILFLANTIINDTLFYIILFALVTDLISVFYNTGILIYRAHFKTKAYVITTIIFALTVILLNIFFISILKLNYFGVLLANFIAKILLSTIVYKSFSLHLKTGKFKLLLGKEMISYGFPLMITNIIFLFLSLSDRFLLKSFGDDTMLGLYAFGAKFGHVINIFIINPFFLAWNPLRWQIFERPDNKEIFAKFNKFLIVFFPVLGIVFCGILTVIIDIATFNEEYLEGIKIIPMIIFSQCFYGLYYFNSMGMLFMNKTRYLSYIIVVSAIVNITLNIILIPRIGFVGTGISVLISYFLLFLLSRHTSQTLYKIQRNSWLETFQIIQMFLFSIAFYFILTQVKNIYLLAAFSGSIFIISILSLFLFKFVSISEIRMIKNTLLKK